MSAAEDPLIHPARGAVMYRRVPEHVRAEIDRAIIERPQGLRSVTQIYRHFDVKEKYDVGITSFRAYARRSEHHKRTESIGTITRELFHPDGTPDESGLQERGHLLLIQQIIRTLEDADLSTIDLQKIASAYTAQRKLALELEKAERARPAVQAGDDPARMAELVREIYGVELEKEPRDSGTEGTSEEVKEPRMEAEQGDKTEAVADMGRVSAGD